MSTLDPFQAKSTIRTANGDRTIWKLSALKSVGNIDRLPYSIRVLLESVLRNLDGRIYTEDHVRALAQYDPAKPSDDEIPFMPGRVVLQDFTGVPCVVDLAAMRGAMKRMGGEQKVATKVKERERAKEKEKKKVPLKPQTLAIQLHRYSRKWPWRALMHLKLRCMLFGERRM